MSGAFSWVGLAGTVWSNPSNWVQGTTYPAGPPGSGDDVELNLPNAVISGSGAAATVSVLQSATLTLTLTATTVDLPDSSGPSVPAIDLAVQNGNISASGDFFVGANTTVSATGATLSGPSGTGELGFQDFGAVTLAGDSALISAVVLVFGTLAVNSGTVSAGTLEISAFGDAYISQPGDLSIAAGSMVSDTLAIVGGPSLSSTVSVDGGTWTSEQLLVSGASAAVVAITGGGSVAATGGFAVYPGVTAALIVGGAINTVGGLVRGSGTLTADGSGSTADVTGDMAVGFGGAGFVTLSNAATVTVSGTLAAAENFSTLTGSASIAVESGAFLRVSGATEIGVTGTANVTIGTGGTLDAGGGVDLGVSTGGDGIVTVGASAELDVEAGGSLTVGDGGNASLDVNGGTLAITSGNIVIANAAGSNADMSVETSEISTTGNITVGQAGTATLSVNQGGGIAAVTLAIGSGTDGNGGFALDGTGSTADVNMLTVGASGVGSVQVTDKGFLSVTGNASFATQASPVQQSGSIGTKGSLIVAGVLDVGKAGTADLTVDTEGQVQAPNVVVGDTAGAAGTLALSGASGGLASHLQFGTLLEIGKSGSGALDVSQGAQVVAMATHSGTVEIGVSAGAAGDVTLSGGGSTLSAALLTLGGGKSAAGGSGTLAIGSGAVVAADTMTVWGGGLVTLGGGTLQTNPLTVAGGISGFGSIAGAVINDGAIAAGGGALTLGGSLSGTGTLSIGGSATLDLSGSVAATQAIVFAGTKSVLGLGDLFTMQGTLSSLAAGDSLVLLGGVSADAATVSGGALVISDAGTALASLALSGGSGLSFGVTTTAGTTDIAVLCFLRGTRIATPNGEVPVEDLRIGDPVRTLSGAARPLRWIGMGRTLVTPRNRDRATPVVVRRHALADYVPRRDLYITRGHALFLDGVLIPVEELVNHRSIAWDETARVVEYYHLELDTHDVLLAEGAAAESYREEANHARFLNAATRPPSGMIAPYAPVLHDDDRVRAVWRRLSERAGRLDLDCTADPDLHLLADGIRLNPEMIRDGHARFRLPRAVTALRIASRSMIPSMLGLGQDQRRLGVALHRATLGGVAVAWDDARLTDGFHAPEPLERHRWTDGAAALPAEAVLPLAAGAVIDLHFTAAPAYPRPLDVMAA